MRRNLSDVERRVSGVLEDHPEILAAYLFGSAVSGRTRPDSDIDIAVLVHEKDLRPNSLKYRLELMTNLGSVLERFDIDLVVMNEAPPALAQNIITKGKLIFERSRSARIAFQVRTLNVFMDTEPMRRLYLHYLKRRYLKGSARG